MMHACCPDCTEILLSRLMLSMPRTCEKNMFSPKCSFRPLPVYVNTVRLHLLFVFHCPEQVLASVIVFEILDLIRFLIYESRELETVSNEFLWCLSFTDSR